MKALSAFIAEHRDEIVRRWESAVRQESVQRELTDEQLRDDLGLLMDQVIEALRMHEGNLVEGGPSATARAHGRQRHTIQHRLPEVVREYGLLFELTLQMANEAEVALSASDVLDLSRCLFTGAAEAADEFSAKNEAERRRADFEFFAFLAHEIRDPLFSTSVAWEMGRRSGEIRGASVDRLERGLSRMRDLVDHALAQSRLTMVGTGAQLNLVVVPIEPLLKDATEDTIIEAEHKGIRVHFDFEGGAALDADARLLRSAFTNLIRNAVKFTRTGGSVALRTRVRDGHVHIEIEDECGGLPPDRAERLFESFVQGTSSSADRRGYGLGLAIARQALEAHRGTLTVQNRPGEGCTFTVQLPITAPASPVPLEL